MNCNRGAKNLVLISTREHWSPQLYMHTLLLRSSSTELFEVKVVGQRFSYPEEACCVGLKQALRNLLYDN